MLAYVSMMLPPSSKTARPYDAASFLSHSALGDAQAVRRIVDAVESLPRVVSIPALDLLNTMKGSYYEKRRTNGGGVMSFGRGETTIKEVERSPVFNSRNSSSLEAGWQGFREGESESLAALRKTGEPSALLVHLGQRSSRSKESSEPCEANMRLLQPARGSQKGNSQVSRSHTHDERSTLQHSRLRRLYSQPLFYIFSCPSSTQQTLCSPRRIRFSPP